MAKIPFDESALMKAINDAMKAAGMSASQSAVKKAIGSTTKSAGRRAPKAPLKGAAAAKPARSVPKITPQTAAGGRGGKKPPKPPTASAAAPKGPKKRDPLGSDADVNRYIMREGRVASQYRKQGGEVSREEAIMADIYEKSRLSKPKPKGPKKPAGGAKKMTRAEKREINVAKHREERSKFLSESSERSRIAKEETRAANRAAWAKRQDEMEARRLAGRKKMNKKKEEK